MGAPLDLDQIHTFVTIADTGSFTRAAEEVHRTQSAVSMQMRRLEERIGKPLFEKDGRTVPVYNDKHLSWSFEKAKWMVDASKRLKFPMLAGSSCRWSPWRPPWTS